MKEETKEKDLRLERLELEVEELRKKLDTANERAIGAEEELQKYKDTLEKSTHKTTVTEDSQTFKCPPPPPALPPPPPPVPILPIAEVSMVRSSSIISLSDAISQTKLQHAEIEEKPQSK